MGKLSKVNEELLEIEDEKKRITDYLSKIYHDPSHEVAFGTANRIYKFIQQEGVYDIPKSFIEDWLLTQDVHTLHLRRRRPKFFSPVISPHIKFQYDVDTAVLPSLLKRGLKYFVLAIDVFSRKVSAQAVKNLKGDSIKPALQEVFNELGFPKKIRTDQGGEYLNNTVKDLLNRLEIEHFIAYPPNKANYAERAIKTIKRLLYKSMQSNGKKEWTKDMLKSVVTGYNKRHHSSIGMPPNKVTKKNEHNVWYNSIKKFDLKTPNPSHFKFNLNDAVRVILFRGAFSKDYEDTFSKQVYFISKRFTSYNINRYNIKTFLNEPVDGSYSEQELQRVIVDQNSEFKIEKILSRKVEKGVKLVKVRWEGYSPKYDSWLKASEVKSLNNQDE